MIPLLDVAAAGDYNAFYIAGFAMAFALAARELNRSGAPAAAALALLAAAGIGGIVGSRLLFFDLAAHGPGEKTVLGGLVGGTLAFLGARTLLRVERASTDALAAALPIGMAVGRIGCFLAGCCFGRPTGAAWGVRYGPGTEPFAAQLAAGLIGPEATATVAVHPVQLYEAGLDVLLALALWRCGGRFRRRGSAFLAFLAGYAVLRVGVEAFRFAGADAATSARPGLVALAGVALAAALIRRELGARADAGRAPATGPDQDRPAARVTRRLAAPATAVGAPAGLAALGIAAGVLAVPGWLTPLERVVVIGLALPAVAAATAAATSAMRRGRRLAPLGATPALALVLLQTPQDSMPPDTTGRARYWSVGGGGMTGAYAETCGGDRRYAVGAASLGYTERLNRDERLSLRGQIFLGRDWQIDGSSDLGLGGVSLAGYFDTRYFGMGLGAAAGSLVFDGSRNDRPIMPSAAVRVGRLSGLFVEARVLDHEPAPSPAGFVKLGLGFGLDDDESVIRLGLSDAGFYGAGDFVVGRGYEISPFFATGGQSPYQVGLMIRRRFMLGSGAAVGAGTSRSSGPLPPPPAPGTTGSPNTPDEDARGRAPARPIRSGSRS